MTVIMFPVLYIISNIIVPGRIVLESNEQVTNVLLNETAILNCTAFSSEGTTVSWERHGEALTSANLTTVTDIIGNQVTGGTFYHSVLSMSEVTRDNNGIYECIARDSGGTVTDRRDFSVVVQGTNYLIIWLVDWLIDWLIIWYSDFPSNPSAIYYWGDSSLIVHFYVPILWHSTNGKFVILQNIFYLFIFIKYISDN